MMKSLRKALKSLPTITLPSSLQRLAINLSRHKAHQASVSLMNQEELDSSPEKVELSAQTLDLLANADQEVSIRLQKAEEAEKALKSLSSPDKVRARLEQEKEPETAQEQEHRRQ